MSYCRFSSDDYHCDIYAYESSYGGYVIHVASNRIVGDIPKIPPIPKNTEDKEGVNAFTKAMQKQSAWMKTCERKVICLPFDGETYNLTSLHDLKNKLLELRQIGYKFPNYVLEEIDAEMKEN